MRVFVYGSSTHRGTGPAIFFIASTLLFSVMQILICATRLISRRRDLMAQVFFSYTE